MISTRSPTSKFSSSFNNPSVIVPKAPIIIGIIFTFMFHSFFNSQARSRYLSFFSNSFSFILWSAGTAKSTILQILFFLLIIIRSGLLAEIRWSVFFFFWVHRIYTLFFNVEWQIPYRAQWQYTLVRGMCLDIDLNNSVLLLLLIGCVWHSGYCIWKWALQTKFKSKRRQFAFYFLAFGRGMNSSLHN